MISRPDRLSAKDLKDIPDGCDTFAEALKEAKTPEAITLAMAKFVEFNGPFAGAVSGLAERVALSPKKLFRDRRAPRGIDDRNFEIAAHIKAALEGGELGDPPNYVTHRRLGQLTIHEIAKFFRVKRPALEVILEQAAKDTRPSIERVLKGYGVTQQELREEELLKALGFHIGSERLASKEFALAVDDLDLGHPDLMAHLKTRRLRSSVSGARADTWLRVHAVVELDHAAHATTAANLALQYYAGKRPIAKVKDNIIEGYRTFAEVQKDFMDTIARGNHA